MVLRRFYVGPIKSNLEKNQSINEQICAKRAHKMWYNKKLSYRRETARQLHTTTWAGQLTFWWSHLAIQCTEHNRIAEVSLFFDIQTLWFTKCWQKTDFDTK